MLLTYEPSLQPYLFNFFKTMTHFVKHPNGTHSETHAVLKLAVILLPQSLECWNYKNKLPCLARKGVLSNFLLHCKEDSNEHVNPDVAHSR